MLSGGDCVSTEPVLTCSPPFLLNQSFCFGNDLTTGFHDTYSLGPLIGEGAFSKVKGATTLKGKNKGTMVAVKCIDRQNLPKEDEEDLLEEVRLQAS